MDYFDCYLLIVLLVLYCGSKVCGYPPQLELLAFLITFCCEQKSCLRGLSTNESATRHYMHGNIVSTN